jgi:hypothetical protein
VIPLAFSAGFFVLLEFAVVWKVDFGYSGYWTYFYIPLYILALVLLTAWGYVVKTVRWEPRTYYRDYLSLIEDEI